MTPVQRKFLALLAKRMANAPEKEIADYVMRLKGPDLQDCLEAFMTVSAKYGIERTSQSVYWGVASLALHTSWPYYALEFEYRSRPEARDEWAKRFAALVPDFHKEALETIATKKRQASPEDHRRLQRFIDIERDVAAAGAAKKAAGAKLPARKDVAGFLDAFHARMTSRTKASRFALDKVIESLSGRSLEDALHAYIEASRRYPLDDPDSLYAFYGLASRAMHWTGGYFALKFQAWIKPDTKSEWAKRYALLDAHQKGELAKDFVHANAHTRILDELRFAYYKAKGTDPDDRALRNFDPVPDDDLRHAVGDALHLYANDADRDDVRGFQASWDRFSELLKGRDILTLVAIVKWCRDWLSIDKELQDELYWNAVGALLVKVLPDRPEEYQHGFNDEERAFFVSPDKDRHPYLHDFSERLRYLQISRDFTAFTELAKVHAALMVYGNKRHMRLATMRETKAVFDRVEEMYAHGPAKADILTVPVTQREGLLKDRAATVSVGDTFGDITIVWFSDMETAYVACRGLDKVLFQMQEVVSAHQLGDLTAARFYDEVYAGTEALLTLIPVLYEVLGFLPDLVTGGLGELAKSIATQYIAGQLSQAVAGEGTGADALELLLNLAGGHLAHGEGAGAKSLTAEARGLEGLEHGVVETRGLHVHGDDPGVAGARLAERPPATTHVEELPPLEAPAVVAREEPGGFTPEPSRPPKVDKLAELEMSEQRELVAARDPGKGEPKGGGGKGEPKGGGGKGGGRKGKPRGPAAPADPQPAPPQSAPPTPRNPTKQYTMTMKKAGGVEYSLKGTGASLDALDLHTNPGLYQVYEIHAEGDVIYTGIAAGKKYPRDATVRLQEHLRTKDGEFISDADSLYIVGTGLEEGPARALEQGIIDDNRATIRNAPERDPQAYEVMFGHGRHWEGGRMVVEEGAVPSVGDTRVHKAIAKFDIVWYPQR